MGVMIVGIRLQMIGAVILGAFTLQPNVVFSKSSGAVLRAVGGGGIVKFIADAAIGTVGGQGINVLPLCWKSKLGRIGWEGGGGKRDKSWRSCWRNKACWSGGQGPSVELPLRLRREWRRRREGRRRRQTG